MHKRGARLTLALAAEVRRLRSDRERLTQVLLNLLSNTAKFSLARLRMVMLSAKGREVDVQAGLALGAEAYVTKLLAIKELRPEVARQSARPSA